MTRRDVEMALIQMGRAAKTIVCAYAPNANHVSIDIVNGTISVNACEWDGEAGDYVEKNILNLTEFADGELFDVSKFYAEEDVECRT